MSTVVSKNYQIGADATATNNFTWYQPSSPDGTVRLGNGNTGTSSSLVAVTSGGNVGVGTANPLGKVHSSSGSFGGSVSSNGNQIVAESSGNAGITIASGATSVGNIFFADSGDTADGFIQYDQSSRALRFGTATATKATLDASGQLGIGTTSPSSQLHLAKALSSTQTNALQIQNTGTFTWGIGIDNAVSNSSLVIQSGGAGGTTRVAIDSSGNLLVGTTSAGGTAGLSILPNNSAGAATLYWDRANTASSSTALNFENNNSTVGSVSFTNTATTYSTSSDYRLKEDVQPMTGALAKVAALKPVTYKWKADGSDGEGFIAHELAEVVPQCVTGEKDAVDAEGNPVYQGIDTSFLVATLTAAIQEQQALITALTARVAALEAAKV